MTNYLDPATNTDVSLVNGLFGDYIQLAADMLYSLMSWIITVIQDNFALFLVVIALTIVGGFAYRTILRRFKMKAVK